MTRLDPASILIVDDEPQNLKLLETLLQSEGYTTTSAGSGEEALAAVVESVPDLILLDIMMPGMDGYQVAKILKGNSASSHIPIIMVTAMVDRNARLAGLNAGAEEFLTKPVDRAELWMRVRNLLRLKAYGDFLQNHTEILERQVRARTADLQRFRTAMDATADAILLVKRSTMQFIEVNDAVCAMLGYTRAELSVMSPEQMKTVSASGGAPARACTRIRAPAGPRSIPTNSRWRVRASGTAGRADSNRSFASCVPTARSAGSTCAGSPFSMPRDTRTGWPASPPISPCRWRPRRRCAKATGA